MDVLKSTETESYMLFTDKINQRKIQAGLSEDLDLLIYLFILLDCLFTFLPDYLLGLILHSVSVFSVFSLTFSPDIFP